jgi:hypothetical protein
MSPAAAAVQDVCQELRQELPVLLPKVRIVLLKAEQDSLSHKQ